ncbi:MAG: uracil-DNA glycosylase [Beijerinckiaceae bacterium]|nr:uracil-DNA glycosylase [Beijerinckiaceae bacterium]
MLPEPPPHTQPSEAELASILRWYVEMGVDVAVGDTPRDHFAEGAAKAASQTVASVAPEPSLTHESGGRTQDPTTGRTAPVGRMIQATEPMPVRTAGGTSAVSPEQAQAQARELAAGAQTLDALREALESFEGCALKRTASRLVFSDGDPAARIMLVGEAPGADEDRQGLPFVGRAGKMLDRMLDAIGLDRTKVYIANVVPWRPPGNRPPTQPEIATCLPFIQRQISLVDPSLVVCVGNISAQALLGLREGITRTRGKWFELGSTDARGAPKRVPAMAMFHPSYLLRAPVNKRYAWQDIRSLKAHIEKLGLMPDSKGAKR